MGKLHLKMTIFISKLSFPHYILISYILYASTLTTLILLSSCCPSPHVSVPPSPALPSTAVYTFQTCRVILFLVHTIRRQDFWKSGPRLQPFLLSRAFVHRRCPDPSSLHV